MTNVACIVYLVAKEHHSPSPLSVPGYRPLGTEMACLYGPWKVPGERLMLLPHNLINRYKFALASKCLEKQD